MRNNIAIAAGMFSAVLVIVLGQMFCHKLYPLPEGMNAEDTKQFSEFLKTAPLELFIILLVGYALASFEGGMLAVWLSNPNKPNNAIIVGGILTVSGLVNLYSIEHPMWFSIVSTLIYIPFAYLGGKVGGKFRKS